MPDDIHSASFDSYEVWYSTRTSSPQPTFPARDALIRFSAEGDVVGEAHFYAEGVPDSMSSGLSGGRIVLHFDIRSFAHIVSLLSLRARLFRIFVNVDTGHGNIEIDEVSLSSPDLLEVEAGAVTEG